MQQILPKTTKICPKTISLKNFEIPPKIEILVFFKIKKIMCKGGTIACAHHLDFSYVFFVVRNQPLDVNFSMPPCENCCFSQGSSSLVGIKICEHVTNTLRNKTLKMLIPKSTLKSGFFGLKNTAIPLGHRKKTFSSTLNVMISQMVRNECQRFVTHIEIQVSYKILWLETPKGVLICTNPLAFKRGCFEAILTRNTLRPLGVKKRYDTILLGFILMEDTT
jgi:hypothetical protein